MLSDVRDFLQNTPLHIAATKNYVTLAQFLIKSCPSMLLFANSQGELPVETAIRNSKDDAAAILIRKMDHRRLGLVLYVWRQHKYSIENLRGKKDDTRMS